MPTGHKADGSPSGPPPPSRRTAVERATSTIPPYQWGLLMEHAWRRRMQGRTIVQIAAETGFSQKQVSKALADYRRANPPADLEEHRSLGVGRLDLQRQRLEVMLDQAMRAAEVVITENGFTAVHNPNLDLARKLVMDLAKLEEREAKLIGYDAPEKREVEVTVQSEEERAMKSLFDRINKEQQG